MKLKKMNKGYTLIEMLLAAGIMGTIALIGMGIMKSTNQSIGNSIATSEVSMLKSRIAATLASSQACENTFVGSPPVRPSLNILDRKGTVVLAPGKVFGTNRSINGELTITGISSSLGKVNTTRLRVDYNTINTGVKGAVNSGVKASSFTMDIYTNIVAGVITGCFADITTIGKEAVKNSCTGEGAVYDAAAGLYGTCTHDLPEVQNDAGAVIAPSAAPVTAMCPAGQFLQEVTSTSGPSKVTLKCKKFKVNPCPAQYYLHSFDSAGVPNCISIVDLFSNINARALRFRGGTTYEVVNLDCSGSNKVVYALDATGNLVCSDKYVSMTCLPNQYITNVAVSGPPVIACQAFSPPPSAPCGAGYYLKKINADGSIPAVGGCTQLTTTASCPSTHVITQVDSSGNATCAKP